jgi:hypothetical protein
MPGQLGGNPLEDHGYLLAAADARRGEGEPAAGLVRFVPCDPAPPP